MRDETYDDGGGSGLRGLPFWLIAVILFVLLACLVGVIVVAVLLLRGQAETEPIVLPTMASTAAVVTVPGETLTGIPLTNTPESAVELVPTFTPAGTLPGLATSTVPGTFTPFPTRTLRPFFTSTPRPPVPTSTRYIPPAPATRTPTATPLATSTVIPTNTWLGHYFNNQQLSGSPAATRNDANLDFNWGTNSPIPGTISADSFSVRWQRSYYFQANTYYFNVEADDGVRVWIDNTQIINEWHSAQNQIYTRSWPLTQGYHTIRVEFYENFGDARIHFWWDNASAYPNWRGEYFTNPDLSGTPVLIRSDSTVDFNWSTSSPLPGVVPNDNFSVRWTRSLGFNAGTYRFSAFADDGVRVWLDGQQIINEWHEASNEIYSAVRTLSAGVHSLRVEYYEHAGDALIQFWYSLDDGSGPQPPWTGQYYANATLSGSPTLTRLDAIINFDWGTASPATGIPANNFSVRWTRESEYEPGIYRIYAQTDDGVRIFINGIEVLDEWHPNAGTTPYTIERPFSAGTTTVVVEYYESTNEASARIWMERLGGLP